MVVVVVVAVLVVVAILVVVVVVVVAVAVAVAGVVVVVVVDGGGPGGSSAASVEGPWRATMFALLAWSSMRSICLFFLFSHIHTCGHAHTLTPTYARTSGVNG